MPREQPSHPIAFVVCGVTGQNGERSERRESLSVGGFCSGGGWWNFGGGVAQFGLQDSGLAFGEHAEGGFVGEVARRNILRSEESGGGIFGLTAVVVDAQKKIIGSGQAVGFGFGDFLIVHGEAVGVFGDLPAMNGFELTEVFASVAVGLDDGGADAADIMPPDGSVRISDLGGNFFVTDAAFELLVQVFQDVGGQAEMETDFAVIRWHFANSSTLAFPVGGDF